MHFNFERPFKSKRIAPAGAADVSDRLPAVGCKGRRNTMKKSPRREGLQMLALGAAAFALGTYQLFSSDVGPIASVAIVSAELVLSIAVYLLIRRKWPGLFGGTWPWKSS
jgi:hypothetical protein